MHRIALLIALSLPVSAIAQDDYREEPGVENVSFGYADVLRVDPIYRTSIVREPREAHDTAVQVWLDPKRHDLPVRATQKSGANDEGYELRLLEVQSAN